jgi:C4-dicarboxylate transporter, DctM subunit
LPPRSPPGACAPSPLPERLVALNQLGRGGIAHAQQHHLLQAGLPGSGGPLLEREADVLRKAGPVDRHVPYAGIFTPTEAAGVAVAFAFGVGLWVHKELKWSQIPKILVDSVKTTSMLFLITASAMLFAHILTNERIPQRLAQGIVGANLAPWMVLLVINILLRFAGDFMEPSSIIMILAPIFYPVAKGLGIDPIHLGIVMTVNMEIGMVTPPVGLNLYVATGITKMSLAEVTKAALPWMLVVVIFLLIVTYFPAISLWLPKVLGV